MEKPLFNDDEELKEQAAALGSKYMSKVVEDENGKHVLCNTNLAYEDEVWNKAYELVKLTSDCLGLTTEEQINEEDDLFICSASEIRDLVLELILRGNNADIVHGFDEI